ncbi:MAG: Tn3 family transposase [Legionellales bacterium]|nr:Tn3 family transposase [Legionellales bacterium]
MLEKLAKVNCAIFRGSNEKEITVWNEGARLLSNAIIYYNAFILTRLFQQNESQGNIELGKLIKRLPPVSWTDVNFYG